jgi:hypothetical protein
MVELEAMKLVIVDSMKNCIQLWELYKILFFVIKYVKIGNLKQFIGQQDIIKILEYGMEIMYLLEY